MTFLNIAVHFFPSHFSLILLVSARFVDKILGVCAVCTYKMVYHVYNVILMNEKKKKFAVKNAARSCRWTNVARKLASRELKSDVSCFIRRACVRSVMSDENGALQIFSGRN